MDAAASRDFEQALRAGAYSAAWRYACRLTASADDARELLQDSLAHALTRFAQLRDPAAFKAWLLAIMRTRFLTALRARRPVVPLEGDLAGKLTVEQDTHPLGELVLGCLRALPAAQREVLELFYLEDLSLAELGRVLGVPAVAVRHRLHRAREALRRAVARAQTTPALRGAGEELP